MTDEAFVDRIGVIGNVDQPKVALPGPGYDATTTGAYFGGGPTGVPSGSFLQALLDGGVVQRVPVTIATRFYGSSDDGMPLFIIRQREAVARQFHTNERRTSADLFLATGDGAGWFVANPGLRNGLMGIAPATTPRVVPVRGEGGNAVVPPGVVAPDGLCYPLRAARLLEYTDVRTVGYKMREITVAIEMKPREMPGWLADPRVFGGLIGGVVLPEDVRVWTFRNAGDGWRLYGLTDMREMAGHGHYLGD